MKIEGASWRPTRAACSYEILMQIYRNYPDSHLGWLCCWTHFADH